MGIPNLPFGRPIGGSWLPQVFRPSSIYINTLGRILLDASSFLKLIKKYLTANNPLQSSKTNSLVLYSTLSSQATLPYYRTQGPYLFLPHIPTLHCIYPNLITSVYTYKSLYFTSSLSLVNSSLVCRFLVKNVIHGILPVKGYNRSRCAWSKIQLA